MRRPGLLLLSSLVWLTLQGPARAADDARAQARALMQEGVHHFDHGDYEPALEKFQAAYRTFANPRILFNLGQAQRGLGRYVEALDSFERFLAEASAAPASARTAATRWVEELRARVVFVELVCDRDGAEVTIDGRGHGRTPLGHAVVLSAGPHQVVVESPGWVTFVGKVDLAAGARESVVVALSPVPVVPVAPVAPPAPVVVAPSGEIAPLRAATVAPAPAPAPLADPGPAPPSGWTAGRKVALGLVVGGAAAVGTGLVFGTMAASAARRINDACEISCEGSAVKGDDDRRVRYGVTQWILVGAGAGALAAGTVVYLLWGRTPGPVSVAPALVPGGVTLSLRSAW